MTQRLSLDRLVEILKTSAGEDDGVDLSGDIADVPFYDLGYDSLALLETAGRVQREFGVVLPDEDLAGAESPRQFLDAVNALLEADSVGAE